MLLARAWRVAFKAVRRAVDAAYHFDGLAEMLVAAGKISKPNMTAWLELVASTVVLPWLVRMV